MSKGTTKRMVIMLSAAAIVFGGIYGFQQFRNKMIKQGIGSQANPPQAVSTTTAQLASWQPTVEAVGTLRAAMGATLAAEVSGLVTAIHFDSGKTAQAGQILVELNAAPLVAQLPQLQANAALAKLNYERDLAQFKIQAVSQAQVDTSAANFKVAQSQVAAQQALIAQKTIRAPFTGQLGIRQVDLGQYVGPGTAIVSLQKLDPINLDFTVPQGQMGLIRLGAKVSVATNAQPNKTYNGNIEAIEPQIDTTTRNLKVRVKLANPHGELLSGMFATARVGDGAVQQYITLPNVTIAYNPYGSTVFVVKSAGKGADGKDKLTAEQRFVTTGMTRGDQVAITSGLKAGETVVTAGQLKLHNGSTVFVNNSIQPDNNPNPTVHDL
ncbi:efflux RND transporter periplasmic adaptor subunit [Sulfuriferula nivalis]|uniref:MexH family multidrug efflux RND transporter periplasmic adaptor subunit n=1 Tax=Sulfuriferula nivalis TaxID=2675298 RepID=A0A809RIT6_9PROT|nr:efflux RND transporter periplasmic adaptor subunit [Sulfuriferula nivalis]BBP01415.1 MexH family multidrug efflux RND transporter periplasmic adaptor subunit [Sulfuriferula nivalis]